MKRVSTIIIVLYSIAMCSQNQTIIPKSGTIVFTKETKVTDRIALEKSLIAFKPKFVDELTDQIILERIMSGIKIDSMQRPTIKKIIGEHFHFFCDGVFINDKINIVDDYLGDKIYSYENQNENKIRKIFYDIKLGVVYNDSDQQILHDFFDEDIVEMKEYRNERKMIQGYNCFKIIYTYNEDIDFSTIFKHTRELWVTENIKSPFSPIVRNQELLFNYYPLEITDYFDGIEGFKTSYILEVLSLK